MLHCVLTTFKCYEAAFGLATGFLHESGDYGEPATHGSGSTTGEDPPGWRDGSVGKLYLAYLRDPDGNKLCALHRPPKV